MNSLRSLPVAVDDVDAQLNRVDYAMRHGTAADLESAVISAVQTIANHNPYVAGGVLLALRNGSCTISETRESKNRVDRDWMLLGFRYGSAGTTTYNWDRVTYEFRI